MVHPEISLKFLLQVVKVVAKSGSPGMDPFQEKSGCDVYWLVTSETEVKIRQLYPGNKRIALITLNKYGSSTC